MFPFSYFIALIKFFNTFIKKYFSNLYYILADVLDFRGRMQEQTNNIQGHRFHTLHCFHAHRYYSICTHIYFDNQYFYSDVEQ